MHRAASWLVLLSVAWCGALAAQATQLAPGTRVRVTAPELGIEKQATTFQALRNDTLVVAADSTMHCPVASITRLEVLGGRRRHTWLGAGIGAGVGLVAGAATGAIICADPDVWCSATGEAAALGAGIGVASGALLGAGVGALFKTDRWEEVPLDRVRLSLRPRWRGGAVRISIAF